jgi:exopolyphosphatase/guanosine-5'-triphosphate,3'-diphosphate pyrophosphatase
MCDAMKAFILLAKVHKVELYTFATSAMRWSTMERGCWSLRKKADIKIEIIDGKKELHYCFNRFCIIY